MTLLKELIEIPEQVHRGDFVLRLTEGVEHAEPTLRDYVVTPELQRCYEDALSFIQGALQTNSSKASYLHGSFGSGKSHFMAVLHLILQGNTAARSIPELASTISKNSSWIQGKKFLLVPYHMIGARDMESGILGGYVDFIRAKHPEAPIPGVYLAEGMFRDAQDLRQSMGDAGFFEKMNGGASASSSGGWGELEATWDADRFEAALQAPPGSEARAQLVSALVSQFFRSYDIHATRGEAYLPLDKGLSVLTKHAASLGYDGLILFLDELILWLASHAADLKFVHQEGQKLSKLVEAQSADRPIPIISFVARQRDLSELIGDSVPGADRLNFSDALKHWEGRFHRITLEDRNLPAIAEKRVLKVKNPAARAELDAAFEKTAKARESVMNTLLTSEGDRNMFRRIYPFSPALIQTLIAVSSVLQRERTALKVMMQLLVNHREVLTVGDVIPVGDLFDVIAHGDEAFSPEMAMHFDNAKRLYHQKLLPLLEEQHGRREELEMRSDADPAWKAFRNDDRLIKTLLLAALVPQVETLRSLNAERLAALNYGTIKSPIPGYEAQAVLTRCKNWARRVGELRIGDESNPTVTMQLSGVDTESIIEQARSNDNQGNRIRRIREMLFEQLGIEDEGEFWIAYPFQWRNTTRNCEILFRNVRELPDSSFDNAPDSSWRVIIDWPFDSPGHGPLDDISRVQKYLVAYPEGAKTLCWIPAFFSDEARKDLGLLVTIEHVLSGERFGQYSGHLSVQDRQAARSLLENQRSVLVQRVKTHLEAAYGLTAVLPGSLDTAHDLELSERFASLQGDFRPRPPAAGTLKDALEQLLDQALSHEFPAAPKFEAETKLGNLKKVYEVVSQAAQSSDGRVAVDKPVRLLLRQIANPLMLGEMQVDATHFVLGNQWKQHFTKKSAETGAPLTTVNLRRWIDEPKPMGLSKEVQNLVILTYAEQTNRSFYRHGVPIEVGLTDIPNECELQEQALPDEQIWITAVDRAASLFGIPVSPLRKASNVSALADQVKTRSGAAVKSCDLYAERLRDRVSAMELNSSEGPRLQTAQAAQALVRRLAVAATSEIPIQLANATIPTSETAVGACISHAAKLADTLVDSGWDLLDALKSIEDERKSEAESILSGLQESLQRDEHAVPLAPEYSHAKARAARLLARQSTRPDPAPVVVGGNADSSAKKGTSSEPTPPGVKTIRTGSEANLQPEDVQAVLARLEAELEPGQKIALNIDWRITEKGLS